MISMIAYLLAGTPYNIIETAGALLDQECRQLEEQLASLRGAGCLTEKTLRDYYGEKRYEMVAESNALEGSTLSVGETELVIAKGITITGHDPAYIRDALSLDRALQRLVELARENRPTGIEQLHELHELVFGERSGGGRFRSEEIRIRGSDHTPPRTWGEIMTQMEAWEAWSTTHGNAPAPYRAAILHAWLAHIHPYPDGNGRTARAISNIELFRAGYPPIIIKKKDRLRYLDALGASDQAGDISGFLELVLEKIDAALTGLELSARKMQGHDPLLAKIGKLQEQRHELWETSVQLLAQAIGYRVNAMLGDSGECRVHLYTPVLDPDDYVALCDSQSRSRTWAFVIAIGMPASPRFEYLALAACRSPEMRSHLRNEGGPSLFWNIRNPAGYPQWVTRDTDFPCCLELTKMSDDADTWCARHESGRYPRMNTTDLANLVAERLMQLIAH